MSRYIKFPLNKLYFKMDSFSVVLPLRRSAASCHIAWGVLHSSMDHAVRQLGAHGSDINLCFCAVLKGIEEAKTKGFKGDQLQVSF